MRPATRVRDELGDAVDRGPLDAAADVAGRDRHPGRVPQPLHLAGVRAGPDDERVAVRARPRPGVLHAGRRCGRKVGEADVGADAGAGSPGGRGLERQDPRIAASTGVDRLGAR